MSGQVRLKENGVLDEDSPTLLESVFKCLSKNLGLVYLENALNNQIELRDDVVIPNEICDRFVLYANFIIVFFSFYSQGFFVVVIFVCGARWQITITEIAAVGRLVNHLIRLKKLLTLNLNKKKY